LADLAASITQDPTHDLLQGGFSMNDHVAEVDLHVMPRETLLLQNRGLERIDAREPPGKQRLPQGSLLILVRLGLAVSRASPALHPARLHRLFRGEKSVLHGERGECAPRSGGLKPGKAGA
jgi:hypothetical protein